MIQDKINQLLGIGALLSKGVKDEKFAQFERDTESLEVERSAEQRILNNQYKDLESLGIAPEKRVELPEQHPIRPTNILQANRAINKTIPQMQIRQQGEFYSEFEKSKQRINDYYDAILKHYPTTAQQSMQSKGQASAIQELKFKSLYNDLANEDTQSLSRNVSNALKKGDRNG